MLHSLPTLSGSAPSASETPLPVVLCPCLVPASLQATHKRTLSKRPYQQSPHQVVISNRNWMQDLLQSHGREHDSPRKKMKLCPFICLQFQSQRNQISEYSVILYFFSLDVCSLYLYIHLEHWHFCCDIFPLCHSQKILPLKLADHSCILKSHNMKRSQFILCLFHFDI